MTTYKWEPLVDSYEDISNTRTERLRVEGGYLYRVIMNAYQPNPTIALTFVPNHVAFLDTEFGK
jgi:hypothetical protein